MSAGWLISDWIIFAGLSLAAVLFVVVPLFFKSTNSKSKDDEAVQQYLNKALFEENLQQLQAQKDNGEIGEKTFAKLKQELELQLEQDQATKIKQSQQENAKVGQWVYVCAAAVVPMMAFFFYQQWGAKPDWDIYQSNIFKVRQQERGASAEELRQLSLELEKMLETRLENREDNLHNWFLLARTYAELENYKSSVEAYQKILDQQPNSPEVISEMAQALYLSNGNRFTEEIKTLFDRAISISPQNIRLISTGALMAYQSGAFQEALGYWQQALSLSQPNTEQFKYMAQALEATKNQLIAAGQDPDILPEADPGSPRLKVSVALGEELELNPDYRVFIYARAWQGPPMPLAVHDTKVADLPLTITLDESMSMQGIPLKLSQFSEWELVARVSQSGVANAQSGDWEAKFGPISDEQSDETFQLVITSRIP